MVQQKIDIHHLPARDTPSLDAPDPFLGLGIRARLKLAAWESKEEI